MYVFVYVFYNIFFLYVIITKHDVFVFLREIDFRFFLTKACFDVLISPNYEKMLKTGSPDLWTDECPAH